MHETVTTPLTETGAYLVEATGDDGRVRGAAIVLISDLAVVKKTDKDSVLCFVVDARSWRPVPGAKVVVRQVYVDRTQGRKLTASTSRGQADGDGIYSTPRLREATEYSARVEAFAYAPGTRYALTNEGETYWGSVSNSDFDEIKDYAYTDRPVYRPKQTVYFRNLIASRIRENAELAPKVGVPVTVNVRNPKGEEVYAATLTSSEFGSVNGKFDLPSGAPLGEYNMLVTVIRSTDDGRHINSDCRFRVEEYKKPEFEVKVTPSATQARFGDTVTATVNAAYYFGAPVAGAKVSARHRR